MLQNDIVFWFEIWKNQNLTAKKVAFNPFFSLGIKNNREKSYGLKLLGQNER